MRVEDREIGRMEHAVADAHHRRERIEPQESRHHPREQRAAADHRQPAEQYAARADAVDHDPRGELREPARRVEHAHQEAERRERHVELRLEQRKQRRQRQLEEVRDAMRDPDQADDPGVVAQRTGGSGIQLGARRNPEERLLYLIQDLRLRNGVSGHRRDATSITGASSRRLLEAGETTWPCSARATAYCSANPAAVDEINMGGTRRNCTWGWAVISMRCRTRWHRLQPRSPTTRIRCLRRVQACGSGSSGDPPTVGPRESRSVGWRPHRDARLQPLLRRTGSGVTAASFGSGPTMGQPMSAGWWHRHRAHLRVRAVLQRDAGRH